MTFILLFNTTSTTEIYSLSLHDALPISDDEAVAVRGHDRLLEAQLEEPPAELREPRGGLARAVVRSEEHTSELQSRRDLVCRLLLEKKKTTITRLRPSSVARGAEHATTT